MNQTGNKLSLLIELIQQSSYCTALTGAGISTLSGLRDFRGATGLYKEYDADKIFDATWFQKAPEYYYKHTKSLIYNSSGITPSLVHNELARWEKLGILKAVITQNIDMLHQKAGSEKVLEIHGTPAVHTCLDCKCEYSYTQVIELMNQADFTVVPYCGVCGGVLKPAITFFGEPLPEKILQSAVEECQKSDLMLILGTSLAVYPAAQLPSIVTASGGKLVVVNRGETAVDAFSEIQFPDLEMVFTELAKTIG